MNKTEAAKTEILPDYVEHLVDIAKREYDIENDRSKILDTKGNMLFALSTAPLYYIINVLDFKQYKNMIFCQDIIKFIFLLLDFIVLLAVFIGFVFVTYFAFRTIFLRSFKRVSIDDVVIGFKSFRTENEKKAYISSAYKNITLENSKINDEKANCFMCAVKILPYILSVFFIWSLIHKYFTTAN